ncbi:MAG TPA: oligopeptide/dipeptide ABC transporter ATP-binding protein [Cellulomonas sp.]
MSASVAAPAVTAPTSAAAEPLVRVEDLTVRFRLRSQSGLVRNLFAVNGVSFSIRRGETLGLVGESGSGKSTTGRALVQLQRATGGSITVDGTDVMALSNRRLRAFRRTMQMIFQDPYGSLNPRMTVGAMIAEPLLVHRVVRGAAARKRVRELIDLVGLNQGVADRFPDALSGGQRQRVGIARALALEPSLIVADEPTSALDVSIQAQIVTLMQDLQRDLGLTYLFISHDLGVVQAMADRVAVMYQGRIVEVLPAGDLDGGAAHPYTRALLAAAPVPDPVAERASLQKFRSAAARDVAAGGQSITTGVVGCAYRNRCPLATEVCRLQTPALRPLVPDHDVACHHAVRA